MDVDVLAVISENLYLNNDISVFHKFHLYLLYRKNIFVLFKLTYTYSQCYQVKDLYHLLCMGKLLV